jgi:rhodanese-related sulfurtransferase
MKVWTEVEASELGKQYAEVKDQYVWVDVRTKEEYAEGHIPGAILIPHDQMEQRYRELIPCKEKPIVLICKSGRRGELAAEVLCKKGFSRLYVLKGGMMEWTGPVTD